MPTPASDIWTTGLLWTLAIVGAWNAVNAVARYIFDKVTWQYVPHILAGVWAALILLLR